MEIGPSWTSLRARGREISYATSTSDAFDVRVSGYALTLSVAVGGTVGPVAIAGQIEAATLRGLGGDVGIDSGRRTAMEAIARYYPSPQGGWFVQAGAGKVTTEIDAGTPTGRIYGEGSGFGMHAGVGWGAFVSDQWSIGGTLRLRQVAEADPFGDAKTKIKVSSTSIGLLVFFTLH